MKYKCVHVVLPPAEHKKMKQMASKAGIPLTTYLRIVMLQHLQTPLKLGFG